MKNIYELRLYDMPLLEFTLEETGLDLKAEILSMADGQKHLFPLDLRLTGEGILAWLKNRVIPRHRAYVEEILKTLGLSVGNTKGIIDVCKGLSLNDSYWIVPHGFEKTFAACNLYENEFSEVLSIAAYTGIGKTGNGIYNFTRSPELTTDGMLPKTWRRTKGSNIYLYKGGTSGAANTGNEPYCEFYSYQIAKTMGLNAVQYDLEYLNEMLVSKCKLFTDIHTAFIPARQLLSTGGLQECFNYYTRLGRVFSDTVASMLILDAVIYNDDRHLGNFGLLRNNRTGKIVGPAPIFDNHFALFNYAMPDDIVNLQKYAKVHSRTYNGIAYEQICSEVMGDMQVQQLQKLIGFKFTRHSCINWPEERLEAIEKHIQDRVLQLLELPRNKNIGSQER